MSKQRVVVSRSSTERVYIFWGLLALIVLVSLVFSYEFGQRRAGHNRMAAFAEVASLHEALDELEASNKELREQLAILQTAADVDRQAYALVESELVDLQSHILELEENLAFYRGIVAPDDSKGVQIQDLQLRDAGEFVQLQLYLTQALRSDKTISGKVEIVVVGQQGGEEREYALAKLISDASLKTPGRFKFRYFEEISAELAIPEGFRPTEVRVKALPDGAKAKSVEESFVWELKAE